MNINNKKMFSIVMLTYNNHDTFKRCITTMTPLILDERVEEVIILDNGSHEISLQKLLKSTELNYNKIRVIYSSENLGIAKGRKYLYDLCKGEYILSFDSDVVIVNAPLLIDNFLKAIKLDKMYLVGGGGGNHIFWPTIFRTDINNLPAPEKNDEVLLVDEIAGWFHGFRSSILVKNGGPIYMDEQFSPFWGEDSDFCYQIKTLGGKCCILGQGSLGHAWSSCDKKETYSNIEEQWKKMVDKWYPKFGKTYMIDFDEKFYIENYSYVKDTYNKKEKYLLEGMVYGHVINPNHIKNLFNQIDLKDNTNLTYNNKEYHTRDFIDKFFNRDEIVKNNYNVVINNLKDCDNAFFFNYEDEDLAIKYITKELIKVNNSAIIIINSGTTSTRVEKVLANNFTNYYLAEFINYYDSIIPFTIALQEIKNKFKNVIKLSLDIPIDTKMNFEKNKDNAFAIDMIMNYFRYRNKDFYNKKGFVMPHNQLLKIVNSYPANKILNTCLRLPTEYSYNISPRFCPCLALDKLYTQMENHPFKNKALVIYLSKIENSDMILNNNKKLRESGNCDIVILNCGEEKFWSHKELDFDYYFNIQEQKNNYYSFFIIFNIIHLYDYSNVILMNDNFYIEEPITEFFEHSYYHNISFLKNTKINLLSIQTDDLMNYANMVQQIYNTSEQRIKEKEKIIEENKDKTEQEIKILTDKVSDIDVIQTIDINSQKNFGLKFLWKEKRTEDENQISIEYSKINENFLQDEEFPLLFDD